MIQLRTALVAFLRLLFLLVFPFMMQARSAWDDDKLVVLTLIDDEGDFGVGTVPIDRYQVAVLGKIKTTEVQVQPTPWPDYVFTPSYQLTPLSEVEEHIVKHGHLEHIPSQAEVEENGISLGKIDAMWLW